MGARTKLNSAYFNGAVLAAAAIGLSMQSWGAFLLTVGVLIAAQIAVGGIRSGGKSKTSSR